MNEAGVIDEAEEELARLRDEVEQLRTALESSSDEAARLAEDRDRLARRVTAQARELQAANAAYARASELERQDTEQDLQPLLASQADEELRVAFEEMQVLTEELETANAGLHEINRGLDQRVEQRTRELAEKAAALERSEARYRTLFESMDEGFYRVEPAFDDEGRCVDVRYQEENPAAIRTTGRSVVGRRMTEVADYGPDWRAMIGRAARTGEPQRLDNHPAPNGAWFDAVAFWPADAAAAAEVAIVFRDVTARRRAEEALGASERWLQVLLDGIPQLVWRAGSGGGWTWSSPQWTAFTGLSVEESVASGWLDAVHPDDRALAVAAWDDAERDGRLSAEIRLRQAGTGAYRWFQTRASPVRAADGGVVEWLGTSTDIDALRQLQDRQRLLVAELQHRVRNILTVVRGMFARTVAAGGPPEELADHFQGRLDNLARTQVIVTQSPNGRVDLEQLVRDELLSVGASDGPTLAIGGPDVLLPPKTAESIGLAIHELTTNALKYGALKVPGASLEIRWTANMDYGGRRQLILTWTEQGVPVVSVMPSRQGFGTELITEALPYRLGAETKLEFRGGGIRCTICANLPADDGPDSGALGA